jgi:hypothetical protein
VVLQRRSQTGKTQKRTNRAVAGAGGRSLDLMKDSIASSSDMPAAAATAAEEDVELEAPACDFFGRLKNSSGSSPPPVALAAPLLELAVGRAPFPSSSSSSSFIEPNERFVDICHSEGQCNKRLPFSYPSPFLPSSPPSKTQPQITEPPAHSLRSHRIFRFIIHYRTQLPSLFAPRTE